MFELCWAFHVRLMLGFFLLDSFGKRGVLFSYSQEHCVCKLQRRWATKSSAFQDKCSSNTFAWVVGHDLRSSCLPYYERLHIHSLLHTSTTYHDRPNTELRNVCYGMPLVGIRCFTWPEDTNAVSCLPGLRPGVLSMSVDRHAYDRQEAQSAKVQTSHSFHQPLIMTDLTPN